VVSVTGATIIVWFFAESASVVCEEPAPVVEPPDDEAEEAEEAMWLTT
jgi:hypothetical protein